ncbi:hypothetical protein SprV_0200699100 [Sparganum proliferum]
MNYLRDETPSATPQEAKKQSEEQQTVTEDGASGSGTGALHGYADCDEWKNFFVAIKAVYGPIGKGTAPLLSVDGTTLLTEKMRILQRLAELFRGVLNRLFTTSDAAIVRLPQVETNVSLDPPSSLHETIRVVQQLSSGKSPGSEAISAEIYRHGVPHSWIISQRFSRKRGV